MNIGLENDLYIGGVYIPPIDSSFYKSHTIEDPYQSLNDKIIKFQTLGDCVITGDFNGRTGDINDFFDNDSDNFLPVHSDPDFYSVDSNDSYRQSRDCKVNVFGKKIIQICKENSLRILNGRTIGDLFGEYTCIKYNGKSVVDYVIVSKLLLPKIQNFKVLPKEEILDTSLSDHNPIIFTLNTFHCIINHSKKVDNKMAPSSFSWKSDSNQDFNKALHLPIIQQNIDKIIKNSKNIESTESIEILCRDVTNIIIKAAEISLKRKHKLKANGKRRWKDASITALRKCILRIKEKLKHDKFNKVLGENYSQAKRTYRKLVRKKNKEFQRNLLNKIGEINNNNPQAMWKIVKALRKRKKQNIPISIEEFKNYYQDLLNFTNKDRENIINKQIGILLNEKKHDDLFDKEISIKELKQAITKLKCGVSPGEDCISNEMLKCSFDGLAKVYLLLFNKILECESIPSQHRSLEYT